MMVIIIIIIMHCYSPMVVGKLLGTLDAGDDIITNGDNHIETNVSDVTQAGFKPLMFGIHVKLSHLHGCSNH